LDLLIPLMPFFATVPIAVAAVVVAKLWHRRRDAPGAELEVQNKEMRQELATLRRELTEAQERLDFTERVLTQQRRERLPDAPDR
jgi:septal ring factor EnvC (AmiA/AmiB activator)